MRLTSVSMNSLGFQSFEKCFTEFLNKVASLKAKYLRANHSTYVTKKVGQAIMLTLCFAML